MNVINCFKKYVKQTKRHDVKSYAYKHLHLLSSSFAFTLAEVLITLGIIGVVAAMTIPTLNNMIQDAQYKTAYKKAYADANQALQKGVNTTGSIVAVTGEGDANQLQNFYGFMDEFKVSKKCIATISECWEPNGENLISGYPRDVQSIAFMDNSGRAWANYYYGLAWIFVDTNGLKKPNQWGKDRFPFIMSTPQSDMGIVGQPSKINPFPDNNVSFCTAPNKCAAEQNYFGTSWLYN